MLMTKLKSKEAIASLPAGKIFLLSCHGCKEVGFPEREIQALRDELAASGRLAGEFVTDYICNPENMRLRLKSHLAEIAEADAVLVCSCGVGVQTVSEFLDDTRVYAGCDTVALPGFQGVTAAQYDCGQCGECYLNLTGGICPITACSKSLVNGPCGGGKNGKCEVDPDMDCGWGKIIKKLKAQGRLDVLRCPTQIHGFHTDEATKAAKES